MQSLAIDLNNLRVPISNIDSKIQKEKYVLVSYFSAAFKTAKEVYTVQVAVY